VFVRHSLEKYSVGGPDYVLIRDLNENAIRVIGSILGQSVALDHYTVEVKYTQTKTAPSSNVLQIPEWEFHSGGCRSPFSPALFAKHVSTWLHARTAKLDEVGLKHVSTWVHARAAKLDELGFNQLRLV
jgi:hypothetical protein